MPKTPFKLWTDRKLNLKHLHVHGCPAEARVYNPHRSKLDSCTISGYFIGYLEKSKGFRFYCPKYIFRIIETKNAKFIENDEVNGRNKSRNVFIEEVQMNIPLVTSPLRTTFIII